MVSCKIYWLVTLAWTSSPWMAFGRLTGPKRRKPQTKKVGTNLTTACLAYHVLTFFAAQSVPAHSRGAVDLTFFAETWDGDAYLRVTGRKISLLSEETGDQ